jgi:hypothetical protein
MNKEQLEEAVNRVVSSWERPHKKVMELKVGAGVGDVGFKFEDKGIQMMDRKHQLELLSLIQVRRDELEQILEQDISLIRQKDLIMDEQSFLKMLTTVLMGEG